MSMPPRLPGRIARLLLLSCALVYAQGRLWRANLLDARGFLPGLEGTTPDTALIGGPRLRGPAEASLGASWYGLLRREGKDTAEILSAGLEGRLWARPGPGMALGLSWSGALDRNRHVDPGGLDLRLGRERGAWGAAWVQGLLAPPGPRGRGEAFLDFAAAVPDGRRQAFAWMLAGGREGIWRLEYGLAQEEAVEDVHIRNLDTAGSGEEVRGRWSSRSIAHRLAAKAPLFGGSGSLLGEYAYGRPRRPDQEFWFCDSSRALHGRLAYLRPAPALLGADGAWEAWAGYREAEAVTIGRRIPPGSEGVKRWHFARNHAVAWEAGGRVGRALPALGNAEVTEGRKAWGWSAGGGWRGLAWRSDPPDDAFSSRRETLSYNRLGLSFIANLYGGLYKMGELVEARADAGTWEAEGEATGRLGPLEAAAGLSLFRAGFAFDAVGRTVSQRLVVLDTAEAFRSAWRGHLLGITPRLRASLDLFPAGGPSARLEAEAAQAFPLDAEARRADAGPRDGGGGDGARLPPFRNAFEARARLVAGF